MKYNHVKKPFQAFSRPTVIAPGVTRGKAGVRDGSFQRNDRLPNKLSKSFLTVTWGVAAKTLDYCQCSPKHFLHQKHMKKQTRVTLS